MSKWIRYDFDQSPDPWPCLPGVYAIIENGIVVYVGATDNLDSRMSDYKFRDGYSAGMFSSIGFIFPPVSVKFSVGGKWGSWWMRESRLIRRMKPKHNCRGTGRPAKTRREVPA